MYKRIPYSGGNFWDVGELALYIYLGWTIIEKNFVTLLSLFYFPKDNFMFVVGDGALFSLLYQLAKFIFFVSKWTSKEP